MIFCICVYNRQQLYDGSHCPYFDASSLKLYRCWLVFFPLSMLSILLRGQLVIRLRLRPPVAKSFSIKPPSEQDARTTSFITEQEAQRR